MEQLLYYLLRASIVSAIFYLFYKAFVSRNTFHAINRAVLLLIVAVSLILPLVSITLPEIHFFAAKEIETETINLSVFENITVIDELPILAETKAEIPWKSILLTVYLLGVTIMLLSYLIGIIRVIKIIRATRKETLKDESSIYISTENIEPFSWMNYIVISEKDFTEANSDIIRHEKAHVHYHHSIDLFFVDVFCSLFWFNPFSWLLRKELRNVHEFQADAEVIKNRNDFRDYQLLLVRHCVGEHKFSIANNFEFNNLQKRIKMIMKTKTSNKAKWLYTCMLFACLVAVITLSAETLKAEVTTENDIEKKAIEAGTGLLSNNILYLSDAKIVDKEEIVVNTDTTQKNDLVIENEDKTNKLAIIGQGDLTNPLYIVDGMEVKDISGINPDDIANIDVLKGKKATDAYGEKGKNGVILITKKRPKIELKAKPSTDINSYNQPLYVVDGVEVKSISEINPDDIESVSVLKNKGATEIYGEKGKNGVILITTKKPKNNITINEMIGGRVPGILDGDGGASIKFRNNTANDKLVIIDGKEGNLNDVDPEDVESFAVLEDKNTTSIYGEKGKNGVILVTTKKIKKRSGLPPSFTPIDKSKELLYILDGVPSDKKDFEALDQKEIESIKLLKGAEATALYGTRGANGVILITTKKGRKSSERKFDKNNNYADKLILIDGVEGNLEDVDAKDIESISVLKDKNTQAVYGERGKKGVIIVTTKKGKGHR